MIGTSTCIYETPCGWCTKWDKKCDQKIPEPPVINQYDYLKETRINKICESEEDHQWACCGISTIGTIYYCTICGKHKTEPVKSQGNITITTYSNDQIHNPCSECAHEDWDMPQCKDCDASNNFKYFEGWENTK